MWRQGQVGGFRDVLCRSFNGKRFRTQTCVNAALCGNGRATAVRRVLLAALLVGCGAGASLAGEFVEVVDKPAVRAGVMVGAHGSVTAPSTTTGRITCIHSDAALDAGGRAGILAPQFGATVIRGSISAGPAVSWLVVPRDRVAGEAPALTTVCTSTP